MATYTPRKDKLLFTLKSLVMQRNIKIQIIITDDGSTDNLFTEIVSFFETYGFNHYKLIRHDHNIGTVSSIYDALKEADGQYIKLISPGDCFNGTDALSNWVKYQQKCGYRWSFCDAVYYKRDDCGKIKTFSHSAHPQIVNVYQKFAEKKCRWNYVVLDDIALGAATLCEKEVMINYISRIQGKVKYAEDNIYRIMMFDGVMAGYYSEAAILYEYGEGISTSNSSLWKEKIREDWLTTDKIMLAGARDGDPFQRKVTSIYMKRTRGSKFIQQIRKYTERGRLLLVLKKHLNRRVTALGL